MTTKEAIMTGKMHQNYVIIINRHIRELLGLDVGDFLELKIRKLEPANNEVKEPENKESVQVAIL